MRPDRYGAKGEKYTTGGGNEEHEEGTRRTRRTRPRRTKRKRRKDPPHTSCHRVININLRHDTLWQIQLLCKLDDKVVIEHDVDQISEQGDESWLSASASTSLSFPF